MRTTKSILATLVVGVPLLLYASAAGATGTPATSSFGPVLSLVAAGGYVYAAVGSCYEANGKCSSPTVKLERSPVQQGAWQTVPGISGRGTELLMTTQGATVWVAMWPTSDMAKSLRLSTIQRTEAVRGK